MNLSHLDLGETLPLSPMAGLCASHHLFDKNQVAAIMTAWHAKRPLLVRGDPGLGKSQLAHAIAQSQNWNLLVHVVNSRTEPEDLLYKVDHVARLAKAQLVHQEVASPNSLAEENFVVPGPLWWAYAPAQAQAFFDSAANDYKTSLAINGDRPSVLLIDEIDKADSELPNALLEVLNNHSFHAHGHDQPVTSEADKRPFVVITSNDQRQLPPAFLRRCVCLELTMKKGQEGVQQLTTIAMAHKPDLEHLSDEVVAKAAELVIDKRDSCIAGEYAPGTSEFLDLLKVLNSELYPNDDARLLGLDEIKDYILEK